MLMKTYIMCDKIFVMAKNDCCILTRNSEVNISGFHASTLITVRNHRSRPSHSVLCYFVLSSVIYEQHRNGLEVTECETKIQLNILVPENFQEHLK